MSSLEKYLFRPSANYFLGCLFSVIELLELLVFLKTNPLSVVSFVMIFSHSECCLLILFIVSFATQ